MDRITKELVRLETSGNFDQCIASVDAFLNEIESAKSLIKDNPQNASSVLKRTALTGQSTQDSLTTAEKTVYSTITKFGKGLSKSFDSGFSSTDRKPLLCPKGSEDKVKQAVLMHLIRIGEFETASLFMKETGLQAPADALTSFQELYSILNEMDIGNLTPAISWASTNSARLSLRGSNLEFLLHKYKFLRYLLKDNDSNKALEYAIHNIYQYGDKYFNDVCHLMGSLLFIRRPDLDQSPYLDLFNSFGQDELRELFKSEYCALLELPPESPLYLATMAGSISLPVMVKIERVMQTRKAEWTSKEELPVEIELPKSLQYHNVFVCPVSKEQTTERNPPMMLKCGHIISLDTLSVLEGTHDGHAFKCPYCPKDSTYYDSKRVFF